MGCTDSKDDWDEWDESPRHKKPVYSPRTSPRLALAGAPSSQQQLKEHVSTQATAVPSPAVAQASTSSEYRAPISDSASIQKHEMRSKPDLIVSWESPSAEASGLEMLGEGFNFIIGDYEEVDMEWDGVVRDGRMECIRKCYRHTREDIYLYWYEGSFGRTGWWFGDEIDGLSGIAWNEDDSVEVPVYGWKVLPSFLHKPRKVRITVKPALRAPPSNGAPSSCFEYLAPAVQSHQSPKRQDLQGRPPPETTGCFACLPTELTSSREKMANEESPSTPQSGSGKIARSMSSQLIIARDSFQEQYPTLSATTLELSSKVAQSISDLASIDFSDSPEKEVAEMPCLQIGTRVSVTTDAALYKRECLASNPNDSLLNFDARKMGREARIEEIEFSDRTARLSDNVGWIPIKALVVYEAGGLQIGTKVEVISDLALYEELCRSSGLSWPYIDKGTPFDSPSKGLERSSLMGTVGYIKVIDLSDKTAQLDSNIWVPILSLVSPEAAEESRKAKKAWEATMRTHREAVEAADRQAAEAAEASQAAVREAEEAAKAAEAAQAAREANAAAKAEAAAREVAKAEEAAREAADEAAAAAKAAQAAQAAQAEKAAKAARAAQEAAAVADAAEAAASVAAKGVEAKQAAEAARSAEDRKVVVAAWADEDAAESARAAEAAVADAAEAKTLAKTLAADKVAQRLAGAGLGETSGKTYSADAKAAPEQKAKIRMPKWEVVGGGDTGGIVVREGVGLKSRQSSDKLFTGAVIEEMELVGDRLRYTILEGTGPAEGWVSTKLPGPQGKVLVVLTS